MLDKAKELLLKAKDLMLSKYGLMIGLGVVCAVVLATHC
jgi:prolipoprotein diacylglyceryltransferase